MTVSILSPLELKKKLAEKSRLTEKSSVVLLDARVREEYLKGHIPGAICFEWENWLSEPPKDFPLVQKKGYWGLLGNPIENSYASRLQNIGIDYRKEIVVYSDGPSSKGREGRVAWMLLYLGAPKIGLLSGGLPAWKENPENKVTKAVTLVPTVKESLNIQVNNSRRCLLRHIQEFISNPEFREKVTLWDSRSEKEFNGEAPLYLPRKGSIPYSTLYSFEKIFQPNSTKFLNRDQYIQQIANSSNSNLFNPNKAKVAYCELGLRAATIALLHEAYTGEKVRIFDGGLMQWLSEPQRPITSNFQNCL